MREFAEDVWRYLIVVLHAWYVLLGSIVWFLLSLWDRLKPFRVRAYLAILGLFLLAAPFPVWREQVKQIAQLQRDVQATQAERDFLKVALLAVRTAPSIQTDKYAAVRARLGFFVQQADSMINRYKNGPPMPSVEEIRAWTERVRVYLHRNAPDPSYEVEFNSAVDPDDENTYSGGSLVPRALTRRQAVLVHFLQQLRRTS